MRIQVELESQRRCENMKTEHHLATEQLIEHLIQARDQVSISYITHNPPAQCMCFYWCTCIVQVAYSRFLNVNANCSSTFSKLLRLCVEVLIFRARFTKTFLFQETRKNCHKCDTSCLRLMQCITTGISTLQGASFILLHIHLREDGAQQVDTC